MRRTFTVDSPIFYSLDELVAQLESDDAGMKPGASGKPIKGDWNGKLTRFISRLSAKVEDRRYGFMFAPPEDASRYEWLSEQVVRLLDSSANEEELRLWISRRCRQMCFPWLLVCSPDCFMMRSSGSRKVVELRYVWSVTKAHLYLPVKAEAEAVERRALETFERIAKEGRKYGVALVVVSQRPSDVSRTILSQCNNFLVLRLTNDQDQSVVRRLMPDSMSSFTEMLPLLETGEGAASGGRGSSANENSARYARAKAC